MVSDVSYNLREVIVNTKYNVVVLLCIEISAVLDSSFINIFDYCFPEIARLGYELAIGISVAHLLSFLLCALISYLRSLSRGSMLSMSMCSSFWISLSDLDRLLI